MLNNIIGVQGHVEATSRTTIERPGGDRSIPRVLSALGEIEPSGFEPLTQERPSL